MSDSLLSLLVSYVFGIFYTLVSTVSSPVTGAVGNLMSESQFLDEYEEDYPYDTDDYNDDGFDGYSIGGSWHYSHFRDPKYKLPCLAAGIDASTVNPQLGSPLFNGRLPPEIRTMIFQFALAEDDDKEKPYFANSHYARPGHMYQKVIHTDLLKTCKAIYLECYKLPVQQAEFRFWMDRAPSGWHDSTYKLNDELSAEVKTLHFYIQQYNLNVTFHRVINNPQFSNVERVIITFRRGDWWFWENETEMTIHPSTSQISAEKMKKVWEVDHAYHGMASKKEALLIYTPPDKRAETYHSNFNDEEDDRNWGGNGWGWQFWGLQKLKRLDIEFESAAYNKPQLDDIVSHALKWRLPYSEDKALVGAMVTNPEIWKGPQTLRSSSGYPTQMPKGVERDDMLIQTVTWTPVSVEELKRGNIGKS